jgi:hypothetical protein
MNRRLDGHRQEIVGGRAGVKQAALLPCAFAKPSMPELISDDLKDRATGKLKGTHGCGIAQVSC